MVDHLIAGMRRNMYANLFIFAYSFFIVDNKKDTILCTTEKSYITKHLIIYVSCKAINGLSQKNNNLND